MNSLKKIVVITVSIMAISTSLSISDISVINAYGENPYWNIGGTNADGTSIKVVGVDANGNYLKVIGYDANGNEITGGLWDELVGFNDDGTPIIIENHEGVNVTVYENFESPVTILKGDINNDNVVDIRDVTAYNQYIVKTNEFPDYLNSIADIDSDGEIGIKDLGLLKKYIVKTIDTL